LVTLADGSPTLLCSLVLLRYLSGSISHPYMKVYFASEAWQRLITVRRKKRTRLARRHLEVCVFSAH